MTTTKEYVILEENDVMELLTAELAISVIQSCFEAKAQERFKAHAKVNINGVNGALRITPGEALEPLNIIGFRLYDVIRNDFSKQPQLIVVYDNQTGLLKGVVISQLLGSYRTAAINAVMQAGVRKSTTKLLGVVGTGYQARTHLETFAKVLQLEKVLIYGRTRANAVRFVTEMSQKLDNKVELILCDEIQDLEMVDSLLLATRSQKSLLDEVNFKQGITITTIGPKRKGRSEVSNAFANSCDLIVTDSIEQVHKYGEHFFITERQGIKDYADLVAKPTLGRQSDEQRILLCSVGMGGTEVALADALITKKLTS